MSTLTERITAYLSGGGLFNPELANHDAVRDLLIDCRDALTVPSAIERQEPDEPIGHIEWDGAQCVVRWHDAGAMAELDEGALIYASPQSKTHPPEVGAQEPVMHMDMDGHTIDHSQWLNSDDRSKEWYSIPLARQFMNNGEIGGKDV